ncbi:hypothetical protein OHC51_03665 [Stenotrophomonas indicatrix]|uniref:InvB/SpaK family type III secretion system chaperone n=1 Tax=Stenotrophomonas indicatrix TaxID=2045451 RepID=UPI00300AA78D
MSLKEILCAALEHLGADVSRFQFDDHSTIAMSFDDVGDVYLDPRPNEQVWLWGLLEPLEEQARNVVAAPLLNEVLREVPHWEAGALTVRADGRVGGLLHSECAGDPEQLAAALQDFHECLGRLQSIK